MRAVEPTQKQINEWVTLNLWKIVRELRKRDEGGLRADHCQLMENSKGD